eukprot:gene13172-biopygen6529
MSGRNNCPPPIEEMIQVVQKTPRRQRQARRQQRRQGCGQREERGQWQWRARVESNGGGSGGAGGGARPIPPISVLFRDRGAVAPRRGPCPLPSLPSPTTSPFNPCITPSRSPFNPCITPSFSSLVWITGALSLNARVSRASCLGERGEQPTRQQARRKRGAARRARALDRRLGKGRRGTACSAGLGLPNKRDVAAPRRPATAPSRRRLLQSSGERRRLHFRLRPEALGVLHRRRPRRCRTVAECRDEGGGPQWRSPAVRVGCERPPFHVPCSHAGILAGTQPTELKITRLAVSPNHLGDEETRIGMYRVPPIAAVAAGGARPCKAATSRPARPSAASGAARRPLCASVRVPVCACAPWRGTPPFPPIDRAPAARETTGAGAVDASVPPSALRRPFCGGGEAPSRRPRPAPRPPPGPPPPRADCAWPARAACVHDLAWVWWPEWLHRRPRLACALARAFLTLACLWLDGWLTGARLGLPGCLGGGGPARGRLAGPPTACDRQWKIVCSSGDSVAVVPWFNRAGASVRHCRAADGAAARKGAPASCPLYPALGLAGRDVAALQGRAPPAATAAIGGTRYIPILPNSRRRRAAGRAPRPTDHITCLAISSVELQL